MGPNVRRLIVEKIAADAVPSGGGLADAIKTDPHGGPDKMIANFYGKMADNGLGKYMPTLPFQDWSDKGAVAAHLTELSNAFYTTSQRKTDVETAAKNADDSKRNWANTTSEIERRKAETNIGYGNLHQ